MDADQTALRQALSQQATLTEVTHPASVSFIDFIDEGPTCALVTALAPGHGHFQMSWSFRCAVIRSTHRPYFSSVVDVGHAHNRGIVHGRLCLDDLFQTLGSIDCAWIWFLWNAKLQYCACRVAGSRATHDGAHYPQADVGPATDATSLAGQRRFRVTGTSHYR